MRPQHGHQLALHIISQQSEQPWAHIVPFVPGHHPDILLQQLSRRLGSTPAGRMLSQTTDQRRARLERWGLPEDCRATPGDLGLMTAERFAQADAPFEEIAMVTRRLRGGPAAAPSPRDEVGVVRT